MAGHRYIPKSLDECTQQNGNVIKLYSWAEKLEKLGQVLFAALIIVGIVSTIIDAVNMADIDEDMVFVTCVTSVFTWGLYALIEYCAYNALALLIKALASITESSIITANVALYEAAKTSADARPEETTAPAPFAAPVKPVTPVPSAAPVKPVAPAKPATPTAAEGWQCPGCGRYNKNYVSTCNCGRSKYSAPTISARKDAPAVQLPENKPVDTVRLGQTQKVEGAAAGKGSLKEILAFAMKYSSESGMRNYLASAMNREENAAYREELKAVLAVPDERLRDAAMQIMNNT